MKKTRKILSIIASVIVAGSLATTVVSAETVTRTFTGDIVVESEEKYLIENDEYEAVIDELYDNMLSSETFNELGIGFGGDRQFVSSCEDDNLEIKLENVIEYQHYIKEVIDGEIVSSEKANKWTCVNFGEGYARINHFLTEDPTIAEDDINAFLSENGLKACVKEIIRYQTQNVYLTYDDDATLDDKLQTVFALKKEFDFDIFGHVSYFDRKYYFDNNLSMDDVNKIIYPDGNVPLNTEDSSFAPSVTTTTTVVTTAPQTTKKYTSSDNFYWYPTTTTTGDTTEPLITTKVMPELKFGIASLQGDVDCNGDIEIADLTQFSKYLLNWEIFPLSGPVANSNADINNDYKHNASDSTLMVEMILNH